MEEKTEDPQESRKARTLQAVNMIEDVKTTWSREEMLELPSDDKQKLTESIEGKQSEEPEERGEPEE